MKKIYLPLILLLLIGSCRKDNRERIFELFYPNFRFTIPAGQSPVLPYPLGIRGVNTNIDFYLAENSTDTAVITEMNALSATLTSVDGLDYNFLDRISIRICEDSEEPCRDADEVFYIDRLQIDRPGDRIRLLPGLRNVRDELISDEYRLEVIFYLAFAPAFNYETQLDMTFGAFR
jgi:hypothetical protein